VAEPAPPVAVTPFRADATLDIGGVYRPGLGAGGNRCFVADPALDRDRLLTAIRVVAADARAVAQVTLFALDSAAAEGEASALDAGDAGLGYGCVGPARVRDARRVASWTWPAPVLRMPDGVGVRLRAKRKVVVQIHYDIAMPGDAFASGTRVELELDDRAQEATVMPVAVVGASLAPGQRYVAVEGALPVARRLRVVGIVPRMRGRGDVMRLEVQRGAASTCLATFDHWHIDNQRLFDAERPLVVAPGDRIRISCAYGTLGSPAPIAFGDGNNDEECVAYLFVTD
jgi:hypothetical protein